MITAATCLGWDTATEWEAPGTSVMEMAPARSAMNRRPSTGMFLSASPNTNHDGRDFQAGVAAGYGSARAKSRIGRWVSAWTAASAAGTSAANWPANRSRSTIRSFVPSPRG